jgi:hypothetical protein
MTAELHPAASHNLPMFVTAPGDTDVLMVVMGIILAVSVVMFGVLFLRLHTLPERMAHRGHKLQFEIVAVLGLIALFTHMHIFWIAGLLLAMIDLPDFGTPLNRIAGSAEKLAGIKPGEGSADMTPEDVADIKQDDERAEVPPETSAAVRPGDPAAAPAKPEGGRASKKERIRA